MKRNLYIALKLRIFWLIFRRRLISLRKLWNMFVCYFSYAFKRERSGRFPFMINIDLSNECNADCVFCRTEKGEIYNCQPGENPFVEKGEMDIGLYRTIIDEVKDHIVIAVLYVNGEPLVYKEIYSAIKYASERNVATMMSTNGILLTEKNALRLIESGICFVKVAISGFSQETYRRQARHGNVEKIKSHIVRFQELNRERGAGVLLMLDFMLYEYNTHEVEEVREFCRKLGIVFNIRPGNTRNIEVAVDFQKKGRPRAAVPVCDWPWKVLTVNWNGDVFPCCDYVIWGGLKPYRRLNVGEKSIEKLWNGKEARKIRKTHAKIGRSAIEICKNCTRTGVAFKY
jgi:radical SAM protein with 4Fe4S-binding SPASM domain